MCLVLRDSEGEMIGYLSPDGPADGRIPSRETLRGLKLFVNLMGLALANAQAHRAEVERRRLLEANQARLRHEATHDALTGLAEPHLLPRAARGHARARRARTPTTSTPCCSSTSTSSSRSTTRWATWRATRC